jgi:hypothetical protein
MSTNETALKYHLRTWARFATSTSEKDAKKFGEMMHYLNREEMQEMLGYLSGYFAADQEGKKLCLKLLE